MKGYTNLKQSKKLLDIGIPAESADMFYSKECYHVTFGPVYRKHEDSKYHVYDNSHIMFRRDLPCWSLAALLGLIDSPTLSKDKLGIGEVGWMVSSYPNNCRYDSLWHDNPIDACIEMILKLKENKYI